MATQYMLTTIDNPYNPFKNWDEWLSYDMAHGYNTCGHLANYYSAIDEATEEVASKSFDEALNEAINYSPYGIHIKVKPDSVIIPISIDKLVNTGLKTKPTK